MAEKFKLVLESISSDSEALRQTKIFLLTTLGMEVDAAQSAIDHLPSTLVTHEDQNHLESIAGQLSNYGSSAKVMPAEEAQNEEEFFYELEGEELSDDKQADDSQSVEAKSLKSLAIMNDKLMVKDDERSRQPTEVIDANIEDLSINFEAQQAKPKEESKQAKATEEDDLTINIVKSKTKEEKKEESVIVEFDDPEELVIDEPEPVKQDEESENNATHPSPHDSQELTQVLDQPVGKGAEQENTPQAKMKNNPYAQSQDSSQKIKHDNFDIHQTPSASVDTRVSNTQVSRKVKSVMQNTLVGVFVAIFLSLSSYYIFIDDSLEVDESKLLQEQVKSIVKNSQDDLEFEVPVITKTYSGSKKVTDLNVSIEVSTQNDKFEDLNVKIDSPQSIQDEKDLDDVLNNRTGTYISKISLDGVSVTKNKDKMFLAKGVAKVFLDHNGQKYRPVADAVISGELNTEDDTVSIRLLINRGQEQLVEESFYKIKEDNPEDVELFFDEMFVLKQKK